MQPVATLRGMPDLTMSEWIDIGVAMGTALLAVATFGIVLEARRARLHERQRRIRASFRTAIIEQLDNARALMSADPARGSDHVGRYLFPLRLRFEAAERLLGTESLPGDLSTYLLWSIGRSNTYAARVHDSLEETARAEERLADSPVRGQWATLVDEVQVIACLLIGHTDRESDLAPLAREFAGSPWERPLRGSSNGRTLARAQDLLAPHRPRWPSGPWYQRCHEQARDDLATAAGTAAEANLAAHFDR